MSDFMVECKLSQRVAEVLPLGPSEPCGESWRKFDPRRDLPAECADKNYDERHCRMKCNEFAKRCYDRNNCIGNVMEW